MELLLVLTMLGIFATIALPSARHALDILAVRSAREAAMGVALQARALAVAHGGADLIFDLPTRNASAVDAQGVIDVSAAVSPYDVVITTDGIPTSHVVLHYDALGIGRMTSRTIHFKRGNAEAGLTFSSFGRVRRW